MPTTKTQMMNANCRNQVFFLLKNMKEVLMFYRDFENLNEFGRSKTYGILKNMLKKKVLRRTNEKGVRIRRMRKKFLKIGGYIYYVNPDEGGRFPKEFLADKISLFTERVQNDIIEAVEDYEWGFDPLKLEGFVQLFVEKRNEGIDFYN